MPTSIKRTLHTSFKSPTKSALVRSKSSDHLLLGHKPKNLESEKPKKKLISSPSADHVLKDLPSPKHNNSKSKPKNTKSKKKLHKSTPKKANNETSSFNQSKSSKNFKSSNKKNKNTSQASSKTVKKAKHLIKRNNFLSQQSFNSVESVRKPIQHAEYFLYQNTYIPIENSAQRRFVCKIREIDLKNESTTDTFFEKTCKNKLDSPLSEITVHISQPPTPKVEFKDSSAQTEKKPLMEFGTNTTPRISSAVDVQTENANNFLEDANKCFSQTLTDLEFLFLPDQKNFQGFSKPQRIHYKELFESIAKKIWANGTANLQELSQEKIQMLLYQRECIQMGMLEYYPEEGFPTHIYSVMSYLTNLFSFAEMREKDLILEKIHSIYGYPYQERYSRTIKGLSTKKKCSTIMSEELFYALQKELFEDHEFGSQSIEKAVHLHNKVIFDAANEELEKFKPFYGSKGEPFPWSINLGMTFFSIDESCLGLLFKQIKQKVLMKFGYLCGILIDYDEYKQLPNNEEKHPVHIKKLEQQEQKMIQQQVNDINDSPEIEQGSIALKTDLATWIMADLLGELCQQKIIQDSFMEVQEEFLGFEPVSI